MIRLWPTPIALLAPPLVPILRDFLIATLGRTSRIRVRVRLDVEHGRFGVEEVDFVVHPDALVGNVCDRLEIVCAHGTGGEASAGGGVRFVRVVGVGVVPTEGKGKEEKRKKKGGREGRGQAVSERTSKG
jgi:hypothetical protein